MKKDSFIRNENASNHRVNFYKKNIGLLTIFSSKEYLALYGLLHGNKVKLIILTLIGVVVGCVEGLKSGCIVGLIKGISYIGDTPESMLDFSVWGASFSLSSIVKIETKEDVLLTVFLCFVLFAFLSIALKLGQIFLNQIIRFSLLRITRGKALSSLMLQDIDYFNESRSGELIFLLNSEAARFSSMVNQLSSFLTSSVQVLIYTAILFSMNSSMTFMVLGLGGFYFLIHLVIDRKLKTYSWKNNALASNVMHVFQQIVYGIKMIKVGGLENREKSNYMDIHRKYEKNSIKLYSLIGLSQVSQDFFMILLFLGMGGFLIINQPDLFGADGKSIYLVSYAFVLLKLASSGSVLQKTRSSILSTYAPLVRVIELIESLPPDTDSREELSYVIPAEPKSLDVSGGRFSYVSSDKPALDEITLQFKQGTLTALVGFSGSGKSTLLDILSGVRRFDEGDLCIDGNSVKERRHYLSYKAAIGYMNQEPIVFHDTLKNNISFFNENASPEEIDKAVEFASATQFLKELPDGLETGLGERGLTISGGERQRVGLARMFLQDSNIMLIDEGTNALDYENEAFVYNSLRKMKDDKIIIVAAHRLSAIKGFDQIVVFDKGRVVEVGKHDELLERKGLYYSLNMAQNATEADV